MLKHKITNEIKIMRFVIGCEFLVLNNLFQIEITGGFLATSYPPEAKLTKSH
jgi:hypothetical protein